MKQFVYLEQVVVQLKVATYKNTSFIIITKICIHLILRTFQILNEFWMSKNSSKRTNKPYFAQVQLFVHFSFVTVHRTNKFLYDNFMSSSMGG